MIMKRLLLAGCVALLPLVAQADVLNGVAVPGPVAHPPADGSAIVLAPPPAATIINFDDFTAPCVFVDSTGPLTTRYEAQGVRFSGVSPNGGVVLNECSNFSVTGHSSPNFLAFNTLALNQLPGGGSPIGPELLTFTKPVTSVQLDAGHTTSGVITLACRDGSTLVGTSTITGTSALGTLSVQDSRITSCTLTFTGTALVVDNLAFVPFGASVPLLTDLGIAALILGLALIGLLKIFR